MTLKTIRRAIRRAVARAFRITLALSLIVWPDTLGVGVRSAQAASVPTMMNYQGRLTDSSNNPISGSNNFFFEIYSGLTGGTQLWSETQNNVAVSNGVFDVSLGSFTALPPAIFANPGVFLQVTVNGTTLSPRQQLISSPFSFSAQQVQGHDYANFVTTDTQNQSIAGVKTFTGELVVPTPLNAGDAATKFYVDNAVNGADLVNDSNTWTGDNTFTNLLSVSSGVWISGTAGFSLQTASGVSVAAGGVTAPFFSGAFYGNGSGLTGVTAGSVAAGNVTAGTFQAGVLLPAGSLAGGPLNSAILPSTVAYTSVGNTFVPAQTFSALITAANGLTTGSSVTASAFFGDGSHLTGIDAASVPAGGVTAGTFNAGVLLPVGSLTGGVVSSAVLPSTVAYTSVGNTFTPAQSFTGLINANGGVTLGANEVLTLSGASGFVKTASSVTASAFFGDGSHLTGVTISNLPAGDITAGTLAAGVLLPAGNLTAGPVASSILPSTVAYTTSANVFSAAGPQVFSYGVSAGSMTVSGGLTASSGTFTATGNTQFSLQTSSGIEVGAGGVTAPFFSGTFYGSGAGLTGVTAGSVAAGNVTAGTFSAGVLLPVGNLAGAPIASSVLPSTVVYTTSNNVFTAAGPQVFTYGVSAGSMTVAGGLTASSGTLTATGSTQFSLQTSSGIEVSGGGVTAPFFSGAFYGNGAGLTGVAAGSVAAGNVTAGTFAAGVLLPAGSVTGGPLNSTVLPSTVAYTTANNTFTAAGPQVFDYGVTAGSITVTGTSFSVGGSTLVTTGGMVGVGTTQPLTQLAVYANHNQTGTITTAAGLGNNVVNIQGASGVLNTKSGLVASWDDSTNEGVASGLVFGREGSDWGTYVAIHTHPNDLNSTDEFDERLRVDMNGNVGINTTAPASLLHMSSGTLTIDGNAANSINAVGAIATVSSVTASAFFGDGSHLSGVTAGAVAAGNVTAGTFQAGVLLPVGDLTGSPIASSVLPSTVAYTTASNAFTAANGNAFTYGVSAGSMTVTGGLTASSATLTAAGNTQFSLQTSSGIEVSAGGVTAPFFAGAHYGDGSHLTGVTAGGVAAANVTAGTFGAGVLLPVGNLTGVPIPSAILPSTVAYTSVSNAFTAAAGNAFAYGVTAGSMTVTSGLTASSATLTAAGNTQFSLQTSSGIDVAAGGVTAPFFSGTFYGSGVGLTNVTATDPTKVSKAGDTMTGALAIQNSSLTVTGSYFAVGVSTLVATQGLVGVGTTQPLTQLAVYANNKQTGTITTAAGLGNNVLNIQGASGAFNTKSGIVASWDDSTNEGVASGLVFGREGTNYGTYVAIHTHPNDTSAFDEFDERLRVDQNGNVGIGTTGPASLLHMSSGTLTIDGNVANSINAVGAIATVSSVTASAFFGDGSHLSGVTVSNVPVGTLTGSPIASSVLPSTVAYTTSSNAFTAAAGNSFIYGVSAGSMTVTGGLTASSGTFTATGSTQFSVQTSSGIEVLAGGVVAPFFSGTFYGSGAGLTGVTAGSVPAVDVTAGTFGAGVLLPVGNLTGTPIASSVLPSTIAYTTASNTFTAAAGNAFTYGVSAGSITVTGTSFTVGGSTLVTTGGMVGVGTTQPLTQLAVYANNKQTGTITTASGLGNNVLNIQGASGAFNTKSGIVASWDDSTNEGVASGLVFGREGANYGTYVAIHTHPNDLNSTDEFDERLRVDMNGNVGINTTAPASLLHMSSGTLTIDGNAANSITAVGAIATASSVTASAFFGDGSHLSGVTASAEPAGDITAGTFGAGVLLPVGNLTGSPIASSVLPSTVAYTTAPNAFTAADGNAFTYGVSAGSMTVTGGLTASSGTLTATGNTQFSLQTSSGIEVSAGGVTAPFFSGTFYGNGAGLTGVPGAGLWQNPGAVVDLATPSDNVVVQSTLTVQGGAFSVGGSTLVVSGGLVGIGTSSPLSYVGLDVESGDININGALRTGTHQRIDSVGDLLNIPSIDGEVYLSGADVGIGTANPQTNLDVNGAAQLGSGVAKSTFTASPGAGVFALQLSSGVTIAGGGPVALSNGGYLQFGDGTIQKTAFSSGAGGWAVDGSVIESNQGDNVVVGSTLTVQGDAFSVGGSTLVVSEGSVGIDGAPNPGIALTVNGVVDLPNQLNFVGGWGQIQAYNSGLNIQTESAQAISFGVNATEKMRVDATGNVGIGTTSPQKPLHVGGDSGVSGTMWFGNDGNSVLPGQFAGEIWANPTTGMPTGWPGYEGTGTVSIQAEDGASGFTGSPFVIDGLGDVENDIEIAENGAALIGVAPAAFGSGDPLTVQAGSDDGGGSGGGDLLLDGGQPTGAGDPAGNVIIADNGGAVGFGADPSSNAGMELVVRNGGGSSTNMVFDNGSSPQLQIGSSQSAAVVGSNNFSGMPLVFRGGMSANDSTLATGTTALAIIGNGNVGVRTASPALALDVNGAAQLGAGVVKSTFTASPGGATYALQLSSGVTIAGGGPVALSNGGYLQFGDGTIQTTAFGGGAAAGWTLDGSVIESAPGDDVVIQSTLTLLGDAFSVGGSSFAVAGGSLTVAYALTAGSLDSAGSLSALNGDAQIKQDPYGNTYFYFSPVLNSQAAGLQLNSNGGDWLWTNNGASNTLGAGVLSAIDPSSNNAPLMITSGDRVIVGGSNTATAGSQDDGSNPLQVRGDSALSGQLWMGYDPNSSNAGQYAGQIWANPTTGSWSTFPGYQGSGTINIQAEDGQDGFAENSGGLVASPFVIDGFGYVESDLVLAQDEAALVSVAPAVFGSGVPLTVEAGSDDGGDEGGGDLLLDGGQPLGAGDPAGNVLIDDNGGLVGIGTTQPSATLQLQNNASSAYALVVSSNNGTTNLLSVDAQGNVTAPAFYGDGSHLSGMSAGGWQATGSVVALSAPTANVVVQSTLTVQGNAFSVGGSTFVVSGGNVGIGTASPAYLLHLSSGVALADGTGGAFRSSTFQAQPGDGNSVSLTANDASPAPNSAAGGVTITAGSTTLNQGGTGGSVTIQAGFSEYTPGTVTIQGGNAQNALTAVGGAVTLTAGSAGGGGGGPGLGASLTLKGGAQPQNGGNAVLSAGTGPTGDGNIQLMDGNVGVGTTSPSATLQIQNSAANPYALAVSSDNGTTSLFSVDAAGDVATSSSMTASAFFGDGSHLSGLSAGGWQATGSVVALSAPAANVVVQSTLTVQGNAFSVGGATFTVSAGAVGIGITNPAGLLDVDGASSGQTIQLVSGPSGTFTLQSGVTGAQTGSFQFITPNANGGGPGGGYTFTAGSGATGGTGGGYSFTAGGGGPGEAGGGFSVALGAGAPDGAFTVTGGDVGLGTTNPATLLHMSSGTLTIDGNATTSLTTTGDVGIGTTNTNGYQLDVFSGASNALVNAQSIAGAYKAQVGVENNVNHSLVLDQYGSTEGGTYAGTSLDDASVLEGQGANFFISYDVGPLLFVNGTAEKMRLTNAGNLGLGTSSPATLLHMSSGTLTIDGTGAGLTVAGSTFVVTGGMVGIGTPNPSYPLQIEADQNGVSVSELRNATNGTSGGASFSSVAQNNGLALYSLSDGFSRNYPGYHPGAVDLLGSSTNGLNIISNIGTGTVGSGTGMIRFITDDSAGGVTSNGTGNDAETRMVITAAGSIGIGTTSPQYTLDVIGSLRATGDVYYGGSAGSANGTAYTMPDYVFKPGYKALDTDAVEHYLRTEGHLPWLTSAKQAYKEHGGAINMTRMGFQTVETAENLQLQIIELNKIVKDLKAVNQGQQAELQALEARLAKVEERSETTP